MVLKIIRFPLVRLVIALAFFAAAMFGAVFVSSLIKQQTSLEPGPVLSLLNTTLFAGGALLAYAIYVRLVEWRPVSELAISRSLLEVSVGLLVGAGMISVVIAILYALGYYEISGFREPGLLLTPFIATWVAGVTEEVALRGIIFRIVEEWLGTWIALAFSALLFGFLHLGNPNSSLLAAVAIAIEAGILLGAVYMVTRRLWAAIGLHAGWNFTLGSVYGGAVSGGESEGLLISKFTGPDIMTGGAFGVEASIVTMVVGLLLAIFYLTRAGRRGNFIAPFWSRPKGA
jgi:hypothetical protein